MLKIKIIAVGKDKDRWTSDGCDHYAKLLSRFASVQIKLLPTVKSSASLSPNEIRASEAERIEKEVSRGYRIALSDHGTTMDSIGFARVLEKLHTQSSGLITLLIGGAHGLDDRVIKRADMVLSLSEMTFSHQLIRLVLLEQLYRAFSIIHGTAYHK